jgi:hypothetical protein
LKTVPLQDVEYRPKTEIHRFKIPQDFKPQFRYTHLIQHIRLKYGAIAILHVIVLPERSYVEQMASCALNNEK